MGNAGKVAGNKPITHAQSPKDKTRSIQGHKPLVIVTTKF